MGVVTKCSKNMEQYEEKKIIQREDDSESQTEESLMTGRGQ